MASQTQGHLDRRRSFLRRSGLTVGGLAAVGALPPQPAQGGRRRIDGDLRRHHPQEYLHALLGRLHLIAEVVNGVWVGQEPGWDSPISRGSHCAKGAATRELVHGDRRLR